MCEESCFEIILFDYVCFRVEFIEDGFYEDCFLFEFGIVVEVILFFKLIIIFLFLVVFLECLFWRMKYFIFEFMFLVCLSYEVDDLLDCSWFKV